MVPKPINLPKQLIFPSAVSAAGNAQGSILIIALWSLCLLATFAVILGHEVRQKITLVQRLDERDRLHFINEAGVKKAIVELKAGEQKNYDSLSGRWSNNAGAFREIDIGDGRVNICYNYDEISGGPVIRYGLVDEESKININKVEPAVLERLFRIVLSWGEAEASDLAASIIDWRDKDSELSAPFGGAEDQYYRNLDYPYEAKDAQFESLDELLLVKGITEDIFKNIKGYITIYGNGSVNINTAPKVVLLALGLSEGLGDKIISFRYGRDDTINTPDDNFFDAPYGIVQKLAEFLALNDAEVAQLTAASQKYFSVNSSNFMVRSLGNLNNRKNIAEVVCVIDRNGQTLSWREY